MSQRAWFFVNEGQASGPLTDAQIRVLISSGSLGSATLVWTDGMKDWGRAGDIAELWPQAPAAQTDGGSGSLAFVGGPWELIGRSLLCLLGLVLVIPGPWAITRYYRWLLSRVQVPGRPGLSFTGQAGDIWYVIVGVSVIGYAGAIERVWPEYWWVQVALFPVNIALWWVVLRWTVANLASEGVRLPLGFNGPLSGFLGWYALYYLSIFTIIGWAWVANALTRWICRHITGSRRQLAFHATGFEMLWRTVLLVLVCVLIVPIPWALYRYTRWYISQFSLTEPVPEPAQSTTSVVDVRRLS